MDHHSFFNVSEGILIVGDTMNTRNDFTAIDIMHLDRQLS
jgi:hypothetical protein